MNLFALVVLFGWIPAVVGLFMALPARRAVLAAFFAGWLFLPVAGVKLPGLIAFDKTFVTSVGALIGVFLADPASLGRVRIGPADLPMLVWILAPLFSAVETGFGLYEGVSGVVSHSIAWGIPYLLGRAYFSEERSLGEFATAMVLGGLAYLPPTLFEMRMSPVLHTWVYGFHQHDFIQSKKGDAFRPTVFMQHGLAVALFLSMASLSAAWVMLTGSARRLLHVPVWLLTLALYAGTLLCRSGFAAVLLVLGSGVLLVARAARGRWPLVVLALVSPAYLFARMLGVLETSDFEFVTDLFGSVQGGSLMVRLESEDALLRVVTDHLLFGFCRIGELTGETSAEGARFICDGMWLYALGRFGLVGLVGLFGMFLVCALSYLRSSDPKYLGSARTAGGVVLAAVISLYSMDCLLNAMVNPIFALAAGGLAGVERRRGAA